MSQSNHQRKTARDKGCEKLKQSARAMDDARLQEANAQLAKLGPIALDHMYQFVGLLLPDGRMLIANSPSLAGAVSLPAS